MCRTYCIVFLFFCCFSLFRSYKKMSLLVEALSRIATARATATIDNDNTHNRESGNTRETRMSGFKYAKYITGFFCRKEIETWKNKQKKKIGRKERRKRASRGVFDRF